MNTILWITMSIGAVLMAIGFYVSFQECRGESIKQKLDDVINNNWRK